MHSTDIATLERLNADYLHADQFNDVDRYEDLLAPDYRVQLPDLVTRDRTEFLALIAKPRPFTGLTLLDLDIRLLGDVALLHGRVGYTTVEDGAHHEALYTDTYQRRDGRWRCVAACVIAEGV